MMETVLLAFMLIAAVCIGAATYNLMKISSLLRGNGIKFSDSKETA